MVVETVVRRRSRSLSWSLFSNGRRQRVAVRIADAPHLISAFVADHIVASQFILQDTRCVLSIYMPEKRKRRVASPSRSLPAGEKLDRTRLRQDADVRWSWVGTKVKRDEDITEAHCLLAAGLGPTPVKPCPNKYVSKPKSTSPTRSASHASSSQTIADEDSAVIVISDDEAEACCNKKRCKDNPYCLNYLGQDKWENEGASRAL